VAEERHCPTCGDTDLILRQDEPVDGWNELACKSCHRVLEIGRPGVGPLVDPLWIDRSRISRAHVDGCPSGDFGPCDCPPMTSNK
jgi:hypothetical protein